MKGLFAELRRRNVIRVGMLYIVAAWLLLQAADVGMSALGLPGWTARLVLLLLGLGFPVALVFAWVYEITPDGIRRELSAADAGAVSADTGRKLDLVIGVLLVIAIGVVVLDRLFPGTPAPAEPVAAEASASTVDEPPERAVAALPATETSIAVLPFADMSPNRDNEYFSDGLTEELLNSLAKIRDLKVAGRTSSFAYKGRDQDLRIIGEELGVAHLLEGSVRKAGNRLRITVQLIKAADGYHLWSETYDRELTDIFAIQTDIAEHVVEALQVKLLGEDLNRMHAGGTTDFDAYNDYLRGIYLLNQGSREATVREAIAALESALARDPEFADAWIALGVAESEIIANGWGMMDESWARLAAAAAQARRHAPQLAGGYMLDGMLLGYRDYRWTEAVRAMRRAVELEPGNATVLMAYAIMIRNLVFDDEAVLAAQRAVQLEPSNLVNQVFLGTSYILLDRCPEAEQVFRQIIQRDPRFPRPRYYLGLCRYFAGDYATALELFEAEPLAWMRATGRPLALYRLGRTEEADAAYAALVRDYADTAAYQHAQVAAQRGDLDLAFERLEHAFRTRDAGVVGLLKDPMMAPLRGDPRYLAALERVGQLQFLAPSANR
jgi:adenylate cyclase